MCFSHWQDVIENARGETKTKTKQNSSYFITNFSSKPVKSIVLINNNCTEWFSRLYTKYLYIVADHLHIQRLTKWHQRLCGFPVSDILILVDRKFLLL